MKSKVRLTVARIEEFTCPADKVQVFLWDVDVPNLAVRAVQLSKAYIFQRRLNGKDIRITIGRTTSWTLEKARIEARRLNTSIDKGIDPREQKAETIAKEESKRLERLHQEFPAIEIWNIYLEEKANKWSPRTLLDHQRLVVKGGALKKRGKKKGESDTIQSGLLFDLLQNPLSKLTKGVINNWLVSQQHRPTSAKGAFVRLRAFLNWCSDHDEYAKQVQKDTCTTRAIKNILPRSQVREGCLSLEQLEPWFTQVRRIHNPVMSAYLQILLLTGARRNEVSSIEWANIDFQWNTLTIIDKVEGERTIPLTPYVAQLMNSLPRRNQFVFASNTSEKGYIQEPRILHKKALTLAGLPSLSLHDLRRSFATLSEYVETPTGITAQIMGHKPSAIAEKHYKRRPIDLLNAWHTKIERFILEQAGITPPTVVSDKPLRVVV